jgi:serine phosphatase RsbU (regulator of sigma subunit)
MRRSSWFGKNKDLKKEEEERIARELAAQAARDEAVNTLKSKIANLVAQDSRFRFTTFDSLNWICPYTGRIINAPFDFEQVARRHLMQTRPFEGGKQPMSLLALRAIAWQHYLREQLQQDLRFGHFRGNRWLNPFTGDWIDNIPLGPNESILPETLSRLASALNANEASQRREFLDPDTVAERLRQADGGGPSAPEAPPTVDTEVTVDDGTSSQILIQADEELQFIPPPVKAKPFTALPEESPYDPTDGWPDTDPIIRKQEEKSGEKERRYDSERARSVQSRLLPNIPTIPGLQFGVHFRPHDSISGDFYDIQRLTDGRVLVALGDVSGHGVQAGLVVQSTVKSLRFICKGCCDLGQIVCKLNQELLEDLLGDQFVTAWFAVIDPVELDLDCVWCGHHPMVAARPGNASFLNVVGQRSAALGVLKPELFARTVSPLHLDLQAGDLILEYTDGATEAMNEEREEFGEHRFFGQFVTSLLAEERLNVQRIVDELAEAVLAYGNNAIDDDLTLFALGVTDVDGEAEEAEAEAEEQEEDAFTASEDLSRDLP